MAGGGSGGGSSGGSSVFDAGAGRDGGLDAGSSFTWGTVSVMPAPGSAASEVVAVAARPGEVWVAFFNGKLFRATTGGFTEVPGVIVPGVTGLHVSESGHVFAAGASTLTYCLGPDCTQAANFRTSTAVEREELLVDLCGAGERVFAIGNRGSQSTTVLYELDAQQRFTRLSIDLGLARGARCRVAPDGTVFIVGQDAITRFSNGTAMPEGLVRGGEPSTSFKSLSLLVADGGLVGAVAVGSDSRVAQLVPGTTTWQLSPPVGPGTSLIEVLALSETEFLAAGTANGPERFLRWDGTRWATLSPGPSAFFSSVRQGVVMSAREVLFVGASGFNPVIVRGTR